MKRKRTESQIRARSAAESKGESLESLANLAIKKGDFPKPGVEGNYSFSWIDGRLRANDDKVADKLISHANTL